jgi:F0F1-type ATP synthase membrane subunit c/vacuolar-type H+-ATPase subunit K
MINRRIVPILSSPNPSKPRIIAIAATLAVGLAAAGCGSSSNKINNASATAALSRPQFLAQGNAICAHGNQTLATAEKALGKQPSEAQFKAYIASTFVPTIQSQIDGLRALGAPSTDQANITNMLDVAQTDLNQVKSNSTALNEKTFTNFAKLAHPYGLTTCAPNN